MAHFVAFELESDEVLVVIARSASKRMQIEQAFTLDIGEKSDSEIGESIKASLSTYGVTRAHAVAIVDRSQVEMRELTIPPSPPEDLPDMVKFQARNEFGAMTDDWTIDFVPYASEIESEQVVLAVAISPQTIQQLSTISDAAGMRLRNIVFRPFAAIDLLRSRLLDGTCRMIVDPVDDQTDLTVTDGTNLVTTRTVKISSAYPQAQRNSQLLGECRRTIASSARQTGGKKIEEILICGDRSDNDELESALTDALAIQSHYVEPFDIAPVKPSLKKPPHTQRFAALLGSLLQADSAQKHELDFLNPRKRPRTSFDLSRFYLVGGVTVAALFLMAIVGWWVLHSQSSTIATLEKERQKLVETNNPKKNRKSAKDIIGEVGKIDDWKVRDVNALDELANISERLLTPDDAIIDLYKSQITTRGDVQIMMKGRSGSTASETKIKNELRSRPYDVESGPSSRNDDETYPLRFQLTLTPDDDPTLGVFNRRAVIKRINDKARKKRAASRAGSNDETNSPPPSSESDSKGGN